MTGEPIAVLPTRAIDHKAVTRRGRQRGSGRDEADGDREAERGPDQRGHSRAGRSGRVQAAGDRPGAQGAEQSAVGGAAAVERGLGQQRQADLELERDVPTSAIISSGRMIAGTLAA